MNEMELDLLAGLMPRRQILEATGPDEGPDLGGRPQSYWIYTNTPIDNDWVAAVFREHGFEGGLGPARGSSPIVGGVL